MSSVDWQRVKSVFSEVLERDGEARATLLGRLRREDPGLHCEVSSLLEAHAAAGQFAEVPAAVRWRDQDVTTASARPLVEGDRIGVFEIACWLGEGGMGTVYRARDTRLGRTVAIKLLHPVLGDDADVARRFADEARTLASLNHPNIGAIFGLEDVAGQLALVLEFVDGTTLAERIRSGPVAVGEALEIARQVADALDAAHTHGFLHRDLKPANIKIRNDGTVKVLDFGLACAFDVKAREGRERARPQTTASIAGTAGYVSPERVRGAVADRRADVWAFGCVLFEMLAGQPVFAGGTIGEIFAEVLKSEPEWQRLPARTPPALRRLLRRCLCKDIRARVRDFADARLDIEDALGELAAARRPLARLGAWTARHAWVVVPSVTLAIAAAVAVSVGLTAPPATHVEQQFDIVTPAVVGASDLGSFAVSPDGSTLAFVGAHDGQAHVWIRPLGAVKPTPVSGTAGASSPFWSRDGKSIAFYSTGRLKRVDLDGGLVRTIGASDWGGGGSWNGDGTILFVRNPAGPILRVAADGHGTVEAVTEVGDREAGHLAPHFLPDGRHFLYYVQGAADKQGIYVSSLVDGRPRKLLAAETAAVYTSGHLLFVRDQTVLAQPFDADRLTLVGTAYQVAREALGSIHEAGPDAVSAAQNGTLAFRVGNTRPHTRYTWIDRSGRRLGEVGPLDAGSSPSASPDLSQLVVLQNTDGNNDVWVMDTRRGLRTKLTTNPAEDVFPMWSAHGGDVIFSSNRGSRWALYRTDFSGGSERPLMSSGLEPMFACDESADGRVLVFQRQGATTGWDLWVADPDDVQSATILVQTAADERNAQLSRDGKWFAYESNASGRYEIFMRSLSAGGTRVQVSAGGGSQVRWRADGRELFYVATDGRLMAAAVTPAEGAEAPELGTPVPLFAAQVGTVPSAVAGAQYVVSRDGQRFLVNVFGHDERQTPIRWILNWQPRRPQGGR